MLFLDPAGGRHLWWSLLLSKDCDHNHHLFAVANRHPITRNDRIGSMATTPKGQDMRDKTRFRVGRFETRGSEETEH